VNAYGLVLSKDESAGKTEIAGNMARSSRVIRVEAKKHRRK